MDVTAAAAVPFLICGIVIIVVVAIAAWFE